MSITHSTFLRSKGGLYVRSPGRARMRDIHRGAVSIYINMIRARKAFWGFPPYAAGSVPSVARFTNKVVAPSWTSRQPNNSYTIGGTDDCGAPFGPPTGYDLTLLDNTLAPYEYLWNGAEPNFTNPAVTSQTTNSDASGTGAIATLSNLRDPGYSYAQSLAASGDWGNSLLSGSANAILAGFDEWQPTSGITSLDNSTFGGPFSGSPGSWAEDVPYYGASIIQNALGPAAHPGSGWYLRDALYVQRARFCPQSAPIWYWFGEIQATAAGMVNQLHFFQEGGIANVGQWVEVPSPTVAPVPAWPTTERLVCVFANQTPSEAAQSLGFSL